MTHEVMTIHRGLAELKLLNDRITKKIAHACFVTAKKNSQDKIASQTVAEFGDDAKAAYESVRDLINRRNAIKRAVLRSNSMTEVEIAGNRYTVVEAIDMKNNGMAALMQLKDKMNAEYSKALRNMETNNSMVQTNAEQFVSNNIGGEKNVKKDTKEYMNLLNAYVEMNTMELVDPLSIKKVIEELDEMTSSFLTEVDAALSVSNAQTTIEVDY